MDDEWFLDGAHVPKALSKDKTRELLMLVSQGDTDAKDEIITHNIRLVLYEVSNRFKTVNYEKKELVSIGIIGLVKATNSYNINKKIEFNTYAIRCIDNVILMFLRKLKQTKNDQSLDQPLVNAKDGGEIRLEDILFDDVDITENIERLEIIRIIRSLVDALPSREKEIIEMYFGFKDGKTYTHDQIGKKFNLSQSYISRIISRIINRMKLQLYLDEIIELKTEEIIKLEGEDMKVVKSIYEYFNTYSKDEINRVIMELSNEEKELLRLRYGSNLEEPCKTRLSKEDSDRFYNSLIPKIRRKLYNNNNPLGRKKVTNNHAEAENLSQESNNRSDSSSIRKEEIVLQESHIEENESQSKASVLEEKSEEKNNDNDSLSLLKVIKSASFSQMLSVLSVKEAVIISLKFGYVDGKYFSNKRIADFLGIKEIEVAEIVKKILLVYKENINSFIDTLIKESTQEVDDGVRLSLKN